MLPVARNNDFTVGSRTHRYLLRYDSNRGFARSVRYMHQTQALELVELFRHKFLMQNAGMISHLQRHESLTRKRLGFGMSNQLA
jgi:hypothetical protein